MAKSDIIKIESEILVNDILAGITADQVVKYFGIEDLLDNIGEDACIKYFRIEVAEE